MIKRPIKRRKLLLLMTEISYECKECGQKPVHNNKPLTLQINHIDGNPSNNILKNLEFLI